MSRLLVQEVSPPHRYLSIGEDAGRAGALDAVSGRPAGSAHTRARSSAHVRQRGCPSLGVLDGGASARRWAPSMAAPSPGLSSQFSKHTMNPGRDDAGDSAAARRRPLLVAWHHDLVQAAGLHGGPRMNEVILPFHHRPGGDGTATDARAPGNPAPARLVTTARSLSTSRASAAPPTYASRQPR